MASLGEWLAYGVISHTLRLPQLDNLRFSIFLVSLFFFFFGRGGFLPLVFIIGLITFLFPYHMMSLFRYFSLVSLSFLCPGVFLLITWFPNFCLAVTCSKNFDCVFLTVLINFWLSVKFMWISSCLTSCSKYLLHFSLKKKKKHFF